MIKYKLVKGGSWNDLSRRTRSAVRLKFNQDNWGNIFGFRIVKSSFNTMSSQFKFTTAQVDASGNITEVKSSANRWVESKIPLPSHAVPLAFVEIQEGTFLMGSLENDPTAYKDEYPQHNVTVSNFSMGQCAISQAQWFAVMGTDYDANGWQERWTNLEDEFKGDNLPIVMVSHDDAMEFCRKLSALTGKTYHLPTEAEWEYACRAGTTTPFSYGETVTPEAVNYDGNYPFGNAPKGLFRRTTVAVDSLYPNPWGLYNMHGNVWEWCIDDWHNSYVDKPEELKQDGNVAWISSDESKTRLLRGGSWYSDANYCRSGLRYNNGPGDSFIFQGFRVVLLSS